MNIEHSPKFLAREEKATTTTTKSHHHMKTADSFFALTVCFKARPARCVTSVLINTSHLPQHPANRNEHIHAALCLDTGGRVWSCAFTASKFLDIIIIMIISVLRLKSDTEWGLERLCKIKKQREIIALDKQGTQQQRPESPTVTPPGVRVNTRYINSSKGTLSRLSSFFWQKEN